MTISDIGLVTALGAFAIVFSMQMGKRWLFACSTFALVCGLVSLSSGEWQAAPGGVLAFVGLLLSMYVARIPRFRRIISAVLILVITGCALPFWFFPIFKLPLPDGPYAIGTVSIEMIDPQRAGVTGRPANELRRLPVRIWYPVPAGAKGAAAVYTSWTQALSLGSSFGERWFYYTQLAAVRTHSMRDLAVAPGHWPVVLFNHGFWSYPEQNTALVERLASHGYIVVSIGHPGDSAAFRLADGTRLDPWLEGTEDSPASKALDDGTAAFMGGRTEDERFAGLPRFDAGSAGHRIDASAHAWRDDNLFVLAALEHGTSPIAIPIMAQADFERIAVAGMSFGGSTAPSACARIANCRAAINLDGESFDFSQYNTDFGRPLLVVLTGQLFSSSQYPNPATNPTDYAYERWVTAGEAANVYRMRVASLRHLGTTDLLLSARDPFKARLYGTIDADRGIALIDDSALEFLDRHVKGERNGFPADIYARYPETNAHDASHVRLWWVARNTALGCSAEQVRAVAPINDTERMRLGHWVFEPSACALGK